MEKVTDYKIVVAITAEQLSAAVAVQIASGMQPFGSVFVQDNTKPGVVSSERKQYCQPMVRYN